MAKVPPLNFRREDIPDLSTGERTDRLLRVLNAFGAEAETLLNGGLTFKENVRAFTKDLTFTAADEWAVLTPASPWTAHAYAPMVRKVGTRVELRGALTRNTAATGSNAFTLDDAKYGPAVGPPALPVGASGGASTVLYFSGLTVKLDFGAATPAVVYLDGAYWDAADATGGTNSVFPIKIRNDLDRKPTHVFLTGAWIVESGTETPVSLGSVAWTESKGQVVIHGLGNVFPGKKHRVTILVVAE